MSMDFQSENETAQTAAPQQTAPSSPFGVVGRKVRAIFAATTQQTPALAPAAPATAPAAPAAPSGETPSLVLIRNCSTKQVLDALLLELGGAQDVSGRYFAPSVQDPARIRQVAASHELFVKESRVRGVVVLDLMVDRTLHPFPPAHRPGPWPRRFRQQDED